MGEYSQPPVTLTQRDTGAASGNHGRDFPTMSFPTFLFDTIFFLVKDPGKPRCCYFIKFVDFIQEGSGGSFEKNVCEEFEEGRASPGR